MQEVGKIFSLLGIIFLILGMLFNFMPNLPKIPGDIYIDKPGIRIYIPWVSSLILSIILTLMFNFFRK
ncbi:DUF2905 domain-containing protein [Candidatus Daviesbacteria bacterium]|nr:DUF2905 domain-containing protein [Candidatus Daviesbacteria bacterium]